MKVAAYCRVSTDQEDQKNSLKNQKKYFQEYISRETGWEFTRIYYDEGISGTQTRRRKGFLEMIKEGQEGTFQLVLTKEVSRFARNTVDALFYTRKLKEWGIGVLFTLDHIDTREQDGELRLTLMAGIAQEESRKISQRVKWGQKRSMEQGVVFGRELLGYELEKGRLRIKEEEAEIVREIFCKYTIEGKGTGRIARELEEQGYSSKRGAGWSAGVIARILDNEKYVGDLCQGKTMTPDYLTHVKKKNQGEEPLVYLKEHHPGIISRSLWEQTGQERERRRRNSARGEKYSARYWCSGKIYCGNCGNSYVSRKKKYANGTVYHGWRCGCQVTGASSCKNPSVNEKTLKEAVWYCLHELAPPKEKLTKDILEPIEGTREGQGKQSQGNHRKETIRVLQEKKRRTIDLALEGIISAEELRQQRQWYEQQIEQVYRQERSRNQETKKEIREEKLKEILDFRKEYELLYGEILEKVTVFPDRILQIQFWGLEARTLKIGPPKRKGETKVEIQENFCYSGKKDADRKVERTYESKREKSGAGRAGTDFR